VSDVSEILSRIESGDGQVSEDLLPLVYNELRRLATVRLAREAPGNSLQPTELVHEAYLRLLGSAHWEGTAHFFAAAAEAMRRILVDRARIRKSQKRGGDRGRFELHDSAMAAANSYDAAEEILVVNDLLDRLSVENPYEGEIAKLCYFADFNVSEAARALEIPISTAHKRWNYAKAWLRREFIKGDNDASE
jgi:RNA polymerase sigma factor (TIGR02999 family)